MVGGDDFMAVPTYMLLNGSERDQELAREILRLTRELRVVLGQFAMYRSLTSDREFGEACDNSSAVDVLRVLVGALLRTIVVSITAIFDTDPQTSNIKKIIKQAIDKRGLEFLGKMHASKGNTPAFERSLGRLTDYRRRLNKGELHQTIARLMHVRNTVVAHFDANPMAAPGGRRAVVSDVRNAVAAATIIVGEANVLILGRAVAFPPLRELLREEAGGLKSTLMRGLHSEAPDRRSAALPSGEPADAITGPVAHEMADGGVAPRPANALA
nr:protein of unassigned function [Methylobacterium oryzae CBMB20]